MIKQLKNWLRGDADWKAEQKLDQSAKRDAFLADAMEGYRSMPEADHEKAIGQLKAQLRNRAGVTPKRSGNWMRIAAAAAVIGLVSIFIWSQVDNPPDTYVAESKQIPPTTNTTTKPKDAGSAQSTESIATTDGDELTSAEETSPAIAENSVNTPKPAAVDPSNIEAGIMEEADLEVMDFDTEIVASDMDLTPVEESTELPVSTTVPAASEPNPAEPADAIALSDAPPINYDTVDKIASKESPVPVSPAKAEAEAVPGNAYSGVSDLLQLNGTVIDENGAFLIGANIVIEGAEIGTVSDFEGSFNLTSNTPLPWTVNVDYIGYESRQYTIESLGEPLIVTLEEGGQLLDEVVVSSGAKKKRQKSKTETVKPVIGFKKMKRYIRKNLEYPEIAKQNNIQGTVIVRFFIGADGTPELLTLQKTLGGGCDAEAIRLIEEGPKWAPTNVWATYTVVFNL